MHEKQAKCRVFGLPGLLGHAKNFDPVKQARTPRKLIGKLNGHHRYGNIGIGDFVLCGCDDREKLELITCEYDSKSSKVG